MLKIDATPASKVDAPTNSRQTIVFLDIDGKLKKKDFSGKITPLVTENKIQKEVQKVVDVSDGATISFHIPELSNLKAAIKLLNDAFANTLSKEELVNAINSLPISDLNDALNNFQSKLDELAIGTNSEIDTLKKLFSDYKENTTNDLLKLLGNVNSKLDTLSRDLQKSKNEFSDKAIDLEISIKENRKETSQEIKDAIDNVRKVFNAAIAKLPKPKDYDSDISSIKKDIAKLQAEPKQITNFSGGGGGVRKLSKLSDVSISSPTNGQVLKYSNGVWVNGVDTSGANTIVTAGTNINVTEAPTSNYAVSLSPSLSGINEVVFNTNEVENHQEGRLYYDGNHLLYQTKIAGTELAVGFESLLLVVNKTGNTLPNGCVVYVNGSQGNRPTVAKADADNTTAHSVIGVVTSQSGILNNEEGYVCVRGEVHGVDLSAYTEGDKLYVSSVAGEFTKIEPTKGINNHSVVVGYVTSATNNGTLLVAIKDGSSLGEQHDVTMTSPTTGDKLYFDGNVWKNKADIDEHIPENGFENRADSTIAFNEVTREFTITGTYAIWCNGNRYVKTGETYTIPNTDGNHFLYYNSAGVFTYSTSPWSILTDTPVAFIFYDSIDQKGIMLEERHGLMDKYTHYYLHHTRGTAYQSGGIIGNYTLSTNTLVANQPTFTSAIIHDEDIVTTTTASSAGNYSIMYRSGATGVWQITTANTVPWLYNAGTNNPQYNQWTGATWQLTDVTSNTTAYVNYYVLVVPAIDTKYQYVIIPGQGVYTSTTYQNESLSTMDLSNFGFTEVVSIYKVTIRRATGTFTITPGRSAIHEVAKAIGSLLQITGVSSQVHNSLSGLQGGTTAQYYHLTAAQHTIATTAATSANDGYLTSSNFTSFTNKVSLTGAESISGVKTFVDTLKADNISSEDGVAIAAYDAGTTTIQIGSSSNDRTNIHGYNYVTVRADTEISLDTYGAVVINKLGSGDAALLMSVDGQNNSSYAEVTWDNNGGTNDWGLYRIPTDGSSAGVSNIATSGDFGVFNYSLNDNQIVCKTSGDVKLLKSLYIGGDDIFISDGGYISYLGNQVINLGDKRLLGAWSQQSADSMTLQGSFTLENGVDTRRSSQKNREMVQYFDLDSGTAGPIFRTASNSNGSTASVETQYSTNGINGYVRILSATTAGYYALRPSNAAVWFADGKEYVFESIVKLETTASISGSDDYMVRFGFTTTNTALNGGVANCSFIYDPTRFGNGNWFVELRSASTSTTQDTGVAASLTDWHRLRIKVNGRTNINFYINGTEVTNSPFSTNIPLVTENMYPAFGFYRRTFTSTAPKANLAYAYFRETYNPANCQFVTVGGH